MGFPGHGDPCQAASSTVDPDENISSGKIRHETDVREDRPEMLAQLVSTTDKQRTKSEENLA